ncbi:hypothetical protein COO72_12450 [Bifidobacterium callitrichos]|nr:hypothetical protein COO72_12450 [Bifidobacterium callitrichos]
MNADKIRTILTARAITDRYLLIPDDPRTLAGIGHDLADDPNDRNVLDHMTRVAVDQTNELQGAALRYITLAWLAFLGMDTPGTNAGRDSGWTMTSGPDENGSLTHEILIRAYAAADHDTNPSPDGDPFTDDDMERLTSLSELTLDQLDESAQDHYGTEHGNTRQRYVMAVNHEINRLLNDHN